MAVDASVGTLTANSYVTIAEADAYFANHIASTSYDAFTQRTSLLVNASRLLDHYMDWFGTAVADETVQAMSWPRDGVHDVDNDIVPQRVKNATFELANHIAGTGGVSADLAEVNKLKIGPISIDLDSEGSGYLLPPQISRILSNLGVAKGLPKNGVSVVSLVR